MYKFKQILEKIGQTKALDLFFYYFVDVLTWTVKVKNKRISVGLYSYRAVGLSDKRTVGLYTGIVNRLSDYSYAPISQCGDI